MDKSAKGEVRGSASGGLDTERAWGGARTRAAAGLFVGDEPGGSSPAVDSRGSAATFRSA
jgi:hypothetical protein